MLSPLMLVGSMLCGLTAAYIALKREKNPYVWFLVGMCFGAMGIFAIFFLTQKPKRRQPAARPALPKIQGPVDKFWYYLDATHTQMGPVSYQAMTSAWHQGKISKSTYVWHEEMTDWEKLEKLLLPTA